MRYTQKSVNRNHTCKPKVVEREIEEKVELERERERERERETEIEREKSGGIQVGQVLFVPHTKHPIVISASDRSFLLWQPVVNKRAFASLPEPFRLALAKVNTEAKYVAV